MFSPSTPVIKIDDPSRTSSTPHGSNQDFNNMLSSSPLFHITPASLMGSSLPMNFPPMPNYSGSSLGGGWNGFRAEDAASDAGSELDGLSDAGSDHGSIAGSPHVGNPMMISGNLLAPPTARFKRKTSVSSLGAESDMGSDDGYLSAGSMSNFSVFQMTSPMIHAIQSPHQSPNPSPELSPSLNAFLFSDLVQNAQLPQVPLSSPGSLNVMNSLDDSQIQAMLGMVNLDLNSPLNFSGPVDLDPNSFGQSLPAMPFGAPGGLSSSFGAVDTLLSQQRAVNQLNAIDLFSTASFVPSSVTSHTPLIPSSVEANATFFNNAAAMGTFNQQPNTQHLNVSTLAANLATPQLQHVQMNRSPLFPLLHPTGLGANVDYPSAPSPAASDLSTPGDDLQSRSPHLGVEVGEDMPAHPTTASAAAALATANAHAAAAAGAGGTTGSSRRPTLYQCPFPECLKTFTRPYNLKSHYRSHTGERPYHCQYCTHTFPRKHDLKRHEKLHGGDKPFMCPACSKSFARADALKRHVKSTDPAKETACAQKIRAMKEMRELDASVGISNGGMDMFEGDLSHVP